ncbi:MAG: sulfotransferase [Rhodobacteraceae bacterium]|nr:sulfotransferase [Paracoccaceae bacterium]
MSAQQIKTSYAEAMRLIAARKTEEALKRFREIIASNPRIAEVHYQVGRIFLDTDRFALAFRPLEVAAELKPNEPAIWAARAEAVALAGRPSDEEKFLAELKQANLPAKFRVDIQDRFGSRRFASVPQTGGLAASEARAAISLLASGQFGPAERKAAALVARHPRSALALNILASAQASLGKVDGAIANYRKAIQIDPDYAEAHDKLGRVYMDQNRIEDAIASFRKAVVTAPYMVSALVNLGICYARTLQSSLSIPLLERAGSVDPNLAVCQIALGNALTRVRNYEQAEAVLARAITLPGGETGEAVALLAQAQARLGKDESAMENFDRALAIDPDSPIGLGGKATLEQTLGNFDEAERLFRRVMEVDPLNGENYRLFTASHKAKAGDPIIAKMIEVFDDPRMRDNDRLNLGFATAKVLEDAKQYDEVFRYLDEANALMRRAFPYDIRQRLREIAGLKKSMAGVDWHGRKVAGTSDYAPIFVTGMPRSGTTLIEQIIASHSTVTGAGEVGEGTKAAQALLLQSDRFRAVAKLGDEEIAGLGQGYADLMRQRFPDTPKITDKSIQTYLYLGLMKLALPNARFIVVRRDPRDNLLSMYKNKFPEGTHLYAYDQKDLATLYGTFVEMIDFWREVVPDWFYEVQYEDLVANPEEETRKLIAACGLEWEDACLSFHENKRKVETLSVYQVRQPITKASVALWQRYEKELKPMLDALKEGGHVPA